MGEIIKYLDTYALVEIKLGNPKFIHYINEKFVINDITLAEFYSVLIREENESIAEFWFKKLSPYSVSVDKQILKMAVTFRYENRKKNISFFDAVGYIHALKNNGFFVTGDKEFEHMKSVEFVKS